MKYPVFFMGLFLFVPAGILCAAYSRRAREMLYMALLVSTAYVDRLDINFIERWWYNGTTRGLEVSFVDFFSLIVLSGSLLSMRRERFRLYWPASLGLMFLFLAWACLNVAISEPRLFGVLEVSKMLRGLLVFTAVAFHVRDARDVSQTIVTVAAVLLGQGLLAIFQRYVIGIVRVPGTFTHPSALADYCCLLGPILLAVSLSNGKPWTRALCGLAWAVSCAAIILTITRMAIFAMLVGSSGVLFVSLVRSPNPRKVVFVVLALVVMSALFLRGYDKFEARHKEMKALEESGVAEAGRIAYYVEAWNMANSHPFGVGLNNWSFYMSAEKGDAYESTSERGEGQREIMAHSAFALTLGELGWIGLSIFVALWGRWFYVATRGLLSSGPTILREVLTGCFFALLSAFLAALTEHNFRSQYFFIVFNIVVALTVAVRRLQDTRPLPATNTK